jgi:hypothetical protein
MKEIKGIKLIRHNAIGINESDDPSYPFRLDATFRAPEFMSMAFICLHGGLEIIQVQGKTKACLKKFADLNGLMTHPRLYSLKIWQPEV